MAWPLIAAGAGLLGAQAGLGYLSNRSRPNAPSLSDQIKFGRFGVPMIQKSELYPDYEKAVLGLEEAAKPKLGQLSQDAMKQQFSDLMGTRTANLGARRMLGGTLEANVTRGTGEDVMRRLGPAYKQMELSGAESVTRARAVPLHMWLERQMFMRGGENPAQQSYGYDLAAHSDKWKTIGNILNTGVSMFGADILKGLQGLGGGAKLGQSFPGDYYGTH